MRLGQGHRHVHVGSRPQVVSGVEDLLVEDRVDRVHDEVNIVLFRQRFDIFLLRWRL
jgi:hypothetical protein